jgi:hypothetical protein
MNWIPPGKSIAAGTAQKKVIEFLPDSKFSLLTTT